jgi:hypothetical protein
MHASAAKRRNNKVGMAVDRLVGRPILARLHGRQRHLFRKLVYTPFSSPVVRPELEPGLRDRLAGIFQPDLERLATLTGQPFTRLLQDAAESAVLCHNPV